MVVIGVYLFLNTAFSCISQCTGSNYLKMLHWRLNLAFPISTKDFNDQYGGLDVHTVSELTSKVDNPSYDLLSGHNTNFY